MLDSKHKTFNQISQFLLSNLTLELNPLQMFMEVKCNAQAQSLRIRKLMQALIQSVLEAFPMKSKRLMLSLSNQFSPRKKRNYVNIIWMVFVSAVTIVFLHTVNKNWNNCQNTRNVCMVVNTASLVMLVDSFTKMKMNSISPKLNQPLATLTYTTNNPQWNFKIIKPNKKTQIHLIIY